MSEQTSVPEPPAFDAAASVPVAATEPLPPERIGRGAAFALLALPVGVVGWVLIWQLGFISALVAFGVAVLAGWLYAKGAGGRVSRAGAAVILGITLVTLAIAFFAGLVSDVLPTFSSVTGVDGLSALAHPTFWTVFGRIMSDPEMSGQVARDALIALAAAGFGTFGTIRRLIAGR